MKEIYASQEVNDKINELAKQLGLTKINFMNLELLSNDELAIFKAFFCKVQNFEMAAQCRAIERNRQDAEKRIGGFIIEIEKEIEKERDKFKLAIKGVREKFGISETGMVIEHLAIIKYSRDEMQVLSENYKADIPNTVINFSTHAKEVISYGREEALRLGNDIISNEHLVLGIIRDMENKVIHAFKASSIDLFELRKEIETIIKDRTGKGISNVNSLPLTKLAEKAIRVAVLEAKAQKSEMVEVEHLMLSILKDKESLSTQILNHLNFNYDTLKDATKASQ